MNEKIRKRSLFYSIVDGSAYSVMAGFVDNFIVPFALLFEATARQIGVLTALPQFLGMLLQLRSADATDRTRSRKRVILTSVLVQALSLIPLYFISAYAGSVFWVVIFYSIYYAAGQFASAPWNSLIGDLVRKEELGTFFGLRNQITGFMAFTSMLLAGIVLNRFRNANILLGFGILFLMSSVARMVSLYFLWLMHEPKYRLRRNAYFTFQEFISRARRTNFGTFVIFIGLMRFSVNLAAPFFTVFMLRDLQMTPSTYAVVTAASAITAFLTMRYWGKYANRFGNKKIFSITALSISIIPFLWLVSHNTIYLILIQMFSGFIWAGFNLSTSNFIFDTVSPEKRTRCTAFYNLFLGAGNVLGALCGGYLLAFLPRIVVSNILTLFVISGLLRGIVGIYSIKKIKEVRPSEHIRHRELLVKLIAVKPIEGLVYETVSGLYLLERVGIRTIRRIGKRIKKN